jgi:uncharacterized phage protein (TIGR01671 family)
MRVIKFRAWHKQVGEMFFVGDAFGTAHPLDCCNYLRQGQPVELMQFTGMLDKNGKEIYEGDILKWEHSEDPLEVRWVGAGWVLFSRMFRKFGMPDGDTCASINTHGYTRNSVVIGNIHERKDLPTAA